jgi:hypothetical protein
MTNAWHLLGPRPLPPAVSSASLVGAAEALEDERLILRSDADASRGSRTDARAENQWYEGEAGCEDGMAAIAPVGSALVYPTPIGLGAVMSVEISLWWVRVSQGNGARGRGAAFFGRLALEPERATQASLSTASCAPPRG